MFVMQGQNADGLGKAPDVEFEFHGEVAITATPPGASIAIHWLGEGVSRICLCEQSSGAPLVDLDLRHQTYPADDPFANTAREAMEVASALYWSRWRHRKLYPQVSDSGPKEREMRTITTHQTNECNEAISLTTDEREPRSGASHHYLLRWYEADGSGCETELNFQHGPLQEVGVNGITNEALLAVLIDRMEGFQSGPYACDENARALEHMRSALEMLKHRTRQRVARGVEGTHEI